MKKLIAVLSGVLVLQLALAITLNLTGNDYGAFKPQQKLVAFDSKAVDGLRIDDGKQSIELSKRDGKWVLPETANFPANETSVERLLHTLAGLEKGWPVATTSSAARHFKVADDHYERKLSLLANGKPLAVLYVGTSPGFRKVHVRADKQDDIYAVAFNTYEANASADDWIDKTVLALSPDDIERVDMPGFELQRNNGELQLAKLADKETTDEKAATGMLDKLAHLSIQSLLGTEAKPEYQQDKPELEFKITRNNGDVLDYRISKPKSGNYYVLKRSDMDDYFKLAEYTVKPLKETGRDKLVKLESGKPQDKAASGNDVAPAAAASNQHG